MSTAPSAADRRRSPRADVVTFCPANFNAADGFFSGFLLDLSETGGGFLLQHPESGFSLPVGEVIHYTVKTPYGASNCSGRTVWARSTDNGYEWGVKFTEISHDVKDPLRCLINSFF